MATKKVSMKQMHRTDEAILDDILRSLWDEETIRMIDFYDISVDVEKGQVCLSGHVSKELNNFLIEKIARSVPGVIAVHNHLATDHDLSVQVAHALATDDRTRAFALQVYCCHGWVELEGPVPNRDIQHAAEEIAARVQVVRGVISLPEVVGEQPAPRRVAFQPHIGVRVLGNDETEGKVSQVIIDPHNRLVTHAVVRVNQTINNWLEPGDYLVPVEIMHVVDAGGILLSHHAAAINQFPILNSTDYPIAPLTWLPPYPYVVGNVRWARIEQPKVEKQFALDVMKEKIESKISQIKSQI